MWITVVRSMIPTLRFATSPCAACSAFLGSNLKYPPTDLIDARLSSHATARKPFG